ncbi:hypothetical protein [Nonomuraea sp. NPDC048901]|uniref:hypothetical protein n=1 Tax=Nonomuraea sp. NPDC048901 TaxID=3155627 RepID=UPI0033F892EF
MTISSPPSNFRVAVRTKERDAIGYLDATGDLDEARIQIVQTRMAFPNSTLQVFLDDDMGTWTDVTDEDLRRIADVKAALALAHLLDEGLPRIDWTLSDLSRGTISGYTTDRDVFDKYLHLLSVEASVIGGGKAYTRLGADGVYRGVPVRLSCHARDEQPAEVST